MSPHTSAAPAVGDGGHQMSPVPRILSHGTRQLWSLVVARREHAARRDRLVAPRETGSHELTLKIRDLYEILK